MNPFETWNLEATPKRQTTQGNLKREGAKYARYVGAGLYQLRL